MSRWHNKLGEEGQRLTILSLLTHAPVEQTASDSDSELSLREAIDELFRIGGEDGRARVLVDVSEPGEKPQFSIEENVPLRDLADRLYDSYGSDGRSVFVLRVLGPGDDPLGESAESVEVGGQDNETSSGPLDALQHLREAVHRLFGGSVEEGVPPTVLSLLIAQPTTASNPPGSEDASQ